MAVEQRYVIFRTGFGWGGILGSAEGLMRAVLPQRSYQEARQLLGADCAVWAPQLFAGLVLRLKNYFSGYRITFTEGIDLSAATEFQRRVWVITRNIPYGDTRSYQWVAEQTGRLQAVRAVGQALARNPLPIIIPCHRVVTAHGQPGGYSGGVQMKQYLLALEASARTT